MSQSGDDPPYLPVGTDVSAKYKGAFCEAKVSKVVRVLQLKVTYLSGGLGQGTVTDEQIRLPTNVSGTNNVQQALLPLRAGQTVQVKHPDKKEYVNATINRIRDCSQYTVVFDDGDITTLRRTALCLKSGRHFNESETLDQLPLTHPEHFGNPVVGGRRGRRSRQLKEDSSDEEDDTDDLDMDKNTNANANAANMVKDVGKVVCVETSEGKRKSSRDSSNWFPGLVVAPTAQATVRINTREECLIRSFKDGRYYTVPRKEMTEFKRDGATTRVDSPPLAEAVDKALNYLDNAELPQHWDKDTLFGLHLTDYDSDDNYTDSSDDEPREEKDHFVAQLYKFMDDRGTPLNKGPVICNRDVDLYRFFRIVEKLGGYNSATNKNKWRTVTARLGFTKNSATTLNLVKQAYFKFLLPFEEFNRKLGCTMVAHPRNVKKNRGRNLIRDRDRATPVQQVCAAAGNATPSPKPELKTEEDSTSVIEVKEIKKDDDDLKKKVKIKDEPIVKIKKESELTDSSSNDGIDIVNDPLPVNTKKNTTQEIGQKKKLDNKSGNTSSIPAKRTKITGEKVKQLIEKFEDHGKADNDDEKVPQQTRSKSGGRKDSVTSSPDRKNRDTKSISQESTTTNKIVNSVSSGNTSGSGNSTAKAQRMANKPNNFEEEKKRGRKRKEPEEKTQLSDSSTSDSLSVTVTNVNIGDKLKVYYGPNLESKVTYEAKVLEIERDDSGIIYLVHYTGWNNRYDEWIKPHRIAENISQTAKGKRPSKQQLNINKTGGNSSSGGSSANNNNSGNNISNVGKRGRGASVSSRNVQDSQVQVRSTTPSSITSTSSRTKSPATPAARAPSARLATKQAESGNSSQTKRSSSVSSTSGGSHPTTRQSLTMSDSDSGSSEEMEDPPKRRVSKRKDETPERSVDDENITQSNERPKRARKTPKKSTNATELNTTNTGNNQTKSQLAASVKETEPKGRDYDLNQIRSELKGFEKALKVSTPVVTVAPSATLNQAPLVADEKEVIVQKIEIKSPKILDETKKTEKIMEKESKDNKVAATDDIYEFKEPEPLELESRSKLNDEKTSKKRRLLEDLDKPSAIVNTAPVSVEKMSPKKKLPARTPPKQLHFDNSKSSPESGEKKSRSKRNMSKKTDDSSETSSPESKSPAYNDNSTTATIAVDLKSQPVYTNADPFDNLIDSPSFNLKLPPIQLKTSTESSIKESSVSEDTNTSENEIKTSTDDAEDDEITKISVNDIKDVSSLENSDEDDAIHEVIRGIAESKYDDDSSDQLLQTFASKIFEPKSYQNEIPSNKDILKETGLATPLCDIKDESKYEIKLEIETKSSISEPLTIKTDKSLQKKEEKTKQISPALQETDSSLLEAAINQSTSDLSNAENIFIPKRTGPRIAGSILQKFDAIKKKEENPSPIKSETVQDDTKSSSDELVVTTTELLLNEDVTKSKELPDNQTESDDSDSSDSEARLIIARSDDESQLSQPESTTNEKMDSVKDTDSNTSTTDGGQVKQTTTYLFGNTPADEVKVGKIEEKIESVGLLKTEEEPDNNISLLLCEETIPGSPAPVNEPNNVQEQLRSSTKPKSAKNLVLEMPFASAPGTSKTADIKLTTSNVSQTVTATTTVVNVNLLQSSTVSSNSIAASANVSTDITTTTTSKSIFEHLKDDLDEPHSSTVNSSPTTPESSMSNLSPLGENGGSSPGTADESNKSQRGGSEVSEAEQQSSFSSVRITKPQHYSEEDTLLNSEIDRLKKSSSRIDNTQNVSSTVSSLSGSSTNICRKRRRSFKGDDIPVTSATSLGTVNSSNNNIITISGTNSTTIASNSVGGAKRGRKPNALKNLRSTPPVVQSSTTNTNTISNNSINMLNNNSSTCVANSDSDDTSEHSNTTATSTTVPVGVNLTSITGSELRLQTTVHQNVPHHVSKYNFIVDLDPGMDASQRIALLQQRIAELRKAYSNEKNELASIERRLKKIRRREREALKAAKQDVVCS